MFTICVHSDSDVELWLSVLKHVRIDVFILSVQDCTWILKLVLTSFSLEETLTTRRSLCLGDHSVELWLSTSQPPTPTETSKLDSVPLLL